MTLFLFILFAILRFIVCPMAIPRIMDPICRRGMISEFEFRWWVTAAFFGLHLLVFAFGIGFLWTAVLVTIEYESIPFALGVILFLVAYRYLSPPILPFRA